MTRTGTINFPTQDRVITLNLTFHDFDVITNCMYAMRSDFGNIKNLGGKLDEQQEAILSMVNGVINLIHEQAKTSTQNLDIDRVTKELDYSENVVTPYFIEAFKNFQLEKMSVLLGRFKNGGLIE
jgi:hypothetical protein